jgi:hypothetical protein
MHLKRGLSEVFERYYPPDVAESLAVMHAQLHVEFARGLSAVPVAEGDVRFTITAAGRGGNHVSSPGYQRARVAKALRKARNSDARGPACMQDTSPDMIRSELRDFMISIGEPVSMKEAHSHLMSFGVSVFRVRQAMKWWESMKVVKRVGTSRTRYAKYQMVEEVVEEPSLS